MNTETYGGHTLAKVKTILLNAYPFGGIPEASANVMADLLTAAEEAERLRTYLDDELKRKVAIQEQNDRLRAELAEAKSDIELGKTLYETARAENERLREDKERLKALRDRLYDDKERMDWLDANKEAIGMGSFHIHARVHTNEELPTLRQAIDAARRALEET
jgi:predicted nuclease with TOPRIM domain